MKMDTITLSLVDDHPSVRKGLVAMLEDYDDLELVHVASGKEQILQMMKQRKSQIVLMDISLGKDLERPTELFNKGGIAATRELVKRYPEILVLMFTQIHDDPETVMECIDAGAVGYLPKDLDADDIYHAIKKAAVNGYFFNDFLNFRTLLKTGSQQPSPDPLSELAIRILCLICKGFTTAETADLVNLSEHGVNYHKRNLMSFFNARNQAELIVKAIKEGYFDPWNPDDCEKGPQGRSIQ